MPISLEPVISVTRCSVIYQIKEGYDKTILIIGTSTFNYLKLTKTQLGISKNTICRAMKPPYTLFVPAKTREGSVLECLDPKLWMHKFWKKFSVGKLCSFCEASGFGRIVKIASLIRRCVSFG